MERLWTPAYPLWNFSQPVGGFGLDYEAWFQELDLGSFGPDAFAVETSTAYSALVVELVGLKGHALDYFHGWVRYGNLVSLLLVAAGVDLEEGEASVKEFLAARTGPFYTMEQFQELLRAAYLGLKVGATRPPVDLLDPPPLIAADGSAVVRLTNHPARDFGPAWSPDGARIAFTSERDGNPEIYVMNADGSQPTNLSNDPSRDFGPAWSPDGARISFTSERDGNLDIYVIDADGSRLTNLTSDPAVDTGPAWSPDGRRIAFISEREGNREIYVMNADGSRLTNLTNNPALDSGPAWSPNGRRIAFISEREGNREIYVMNADGSRPTNLSNSADSNGTLAWSPDGRRIAFSSWRFGDTGIYVTNADGSGLTRLTNHPSADSSPAWSPGGARIAFISHRGRSFRGGTESIGHPEIYVMNADGSRPDPPN